MKENRILYIFLLIVTFSLCCFYSGHILPFIFFFLMACPVISFFIFIFSIIFTSVDAGKSFSSLGAKGYAVRGAKLELHFCIKNKFIFPLSPVMLVIYNGETSSKESCKNISQESVSIAPLSCVFVSMNEEFKNCGEYDIGIKNIYFYDILGLFCFCKNINLIKKIEVYPRIIKSEAPIEHSFSENEKEVFSPLLFSPAYSSSYFSREYKQGDNIKFLNHKLSAKKDKLIIKQHESAAGSEIIILADFSENNTKNENDAVSEAVLSLCFSGIHYGADITVYYGEKSNEITIFEDINTLGHAFFSITCKDNINTKKDKKTKKPKISKDNNTNENAYTFKKLCRNFSSSCAAIYIVTPNLSEDFIEFLKTERFDDKNFATLLVFENKENIQNTVLPTFRRMKIKTLDPDYPCFI